MTVILCRSDPERIIAHRRGAPQFRQYLVDKSRFNADCGVIELTDRARAPQIHTL